MRLLLISNSTNPGEAYLEYPKEQIKTFLKDTRKVLFIPYAAVSFTFDEYERKVQQRFSELGIEVESIHHSKFPKKSVQDAEAIVVGGGNTFRLLKMIHLFDLVEAVRFKVLSGTPYIGWSAGANVACLTICTTNDMPITEPDNFSAFNLVRFQINPHFIDTHPEGHAGETREQRILEFLEMDPYVYVVGLREGSMILLENVKLTLLGKKPARVFKKGLPPKEVNPGDDLDFLFE